jgi:putative transposase
LIFLHRTTATTRLVMIALARFFDWREALIVVKPATFLKWHRLGFRLFWKWKSRRRGRPRLPRNLRQLIRDIASANPIWGEERIANELSLKLGIRVSPRTVRKYLAPMRPGSGTSDQRWATFLRNHARAVVACDFFVSVTTAFQVLYVFVAMEVGSRRILHCNVTDHPTAEWTTQQFREVLADCHPYKFVVHDRDSIFSSLLDRTLEDFGVRVLRTPIRAQSERVLRTADRNDPARMFGLRDPHQPKTFAANVEGVRLLLQPRPPARIFGSWNTGANPSERSGQRPSASASRRLSRQFEACSRRIAP